MLRAEKIVQRFPRKGGWITVLDGLSISLAPGQRLGVQGPSGCGKSTLAQILALLRQPEAGEVYVDDVRVERWRTETPRELRRHVQLLWQSPRLASDPRLRLRDLILEPLAAHGLLPRSAAAQDAVLERWLGSVGLTPELLTRQPHEVSDGQLQRACLARALVLEPRYLICDEISSMLDVSTQAALLQAIRLEQARRELGVLLISHDRVLVDHWCTDKIIFTATHGHAPTATIHEHDVFAGHAH